jgi:DNA repair exonuclease SbcCD ATPase subunit
MSEVEQLRKQLEEVQAENKKLTEARDELLVGMEKIGWPCRLVELPSEYKRLAREVERLNAALAKQQDSAKDAVESDEVKWVWVNPSEYRAIVGAAKVGVWKQYDKELWAWEMRHRSKPYQCGEVRTEAEAKEVALAAARGLR